MYLRGLLACGMETPSFCSFLLCRSKVGGCPQIWLSIPDSPQRIQSNRGSSTPEAARDSGSRESETSTNAHTSWRSVAWASNENARLVRPEEAGPHNSSKDPRGKPPPSTASSSATPLGWSAMTERLWNPSRPRPMKGSCLPCFRDWEIMVLDSLFLRLRYFSSRGGKVVKRSGGKGMPDRGVAQFPYCS